MTKLSKAQDAAIEVLAKRNLEYNFDREKYGNVNYFVPYSACGIKYQVVWAKALDGYIERQRNGSGLVRLTDAGRAYAIERGWLAAEAAPVAEAAETYALKVGDRVRPTVNRLIYEIGDVGTILRIIPLSQSVRPCAEVRFNHLGYPKIVELAHLKLDTPSESQPAAALPAPDSQFVDAGTHVRVDSEHTRVVEENIPVYEVKVGDKVFYRGWVTIARIEPHNIVVNDTTWYEFFTESGSRFSTGGKLLVERRYVRENVKTSDVLKLESELQAARAEIARLNDKLDATKTGMNMFIGVFNALSKWSRSIPNTDERFETWKYYVHLTNQEYERLTTLVVNHSSYFDELESATS